MIAHGSVDELRLKFEKQKLLETKLDTIRGLPHLYGWKWYDWAWKFYTSQNHYNFLCSANQVSKSSSATRKMITWATDQSLWPILWRSQPLQFWYLYPNSNTATIEVEKKWIPQFLPRGKFKDDPIYGWRSEYKNRVIFAIHFHSGVSIYFKTYGQDVHDLQTGSCDYIVADEELPEELYSELNSRLLATDGYLDLVFTATIGQEYLRCAMEEIGTKDETFKDAFKQQISMYDCMHYMDGTASPWTLERIERAKNSCKSEAEIQRRIYGRFVVDGNLKYGAFSKAKNLNPDIKPIPKDWLIYSGVDIGSGGTQAHPAAIAFVAVRPDFRFGRVFKGCRMDGQLTTSSDILAQHTSMKQGYQMTGQHYDWQSKEFFMISSRVGEAFTPAEKSHDIGEQFINVLFKNCMLEIDDIPENATLVTELVTLKKDTPKTKCKDDHIDAVRYAITKIPWDWQAITGKPIEMEAEFRHLTEEEQRRGDNQKLEDQLSVFDVEQEIDEWNELMES